MADILANMISGVRAQFANEAHTSLSNSHGHHFAVHQPKVQPVRRPPPPRRDLAKMMDLTPAADPQKQLAEKEQKIAAHNARINSINNSKAKEPVAETPKK